MVFLIERTKTNIESMFNIDGRAKRRLRRKKLRNNHQ